MHKPAPAQPATTGGCLVLGMGQLGQCLRAAQPATGAAAAAVVYLGHADLDITDYPAVVAKIQQLQPQVLINATAYTAVDQAETDIDLAYKVNAFAVEHLARACAEQGTALLHVSTDFVFGGQDDSAVDHRRQHKPWLPTDQTHPMGVYGASKLVGEQAILATANLRACIVRTSWLYSEYGQNFVKTMLRLMAERDTLGVVDDQVGAPTDALGLARVLWALAASCLAAAPNMPTGICHWSDQGQISWYAFAVEIQAQALALGLLSRPIPINAIATHDYPTPARRPAYSVLDSQQLAQALAIPQAAWQVNLQRVLQALTNT